MQEASIKTIAIILSTYLGILLISFIVGGKNAIVGTTMIASIITLLTSFVGLLIMISKEKRKLGANIFISSLLILLIGFGVCTSNI